MASHVVDWFASQIRNRRERGDEARVMELEALLGEVRRLERGLVLACRDVARLRLLANRDETGEDFSEDDVRLCGADEMREVMVRVAKGECTHE